jgi:hypothetical protein
MRMLFTNTILHIFYKCAFVQRTILVSSQRMKQALCISVTNSLMVCPELQLFPALRGGNTSQKVNCGVDEVLECVKKNLLVILRKF